jgi:predicted RecA/RadA family phage recombinase
MATNFIAPGDVVELTAPVGGAVAGTGYKIGRLFAVCTVTTAAGLKFSGALTGTWSLNKVNLEPWTEGLLVYYNSASALCTSVSTTAILIGAAVRTEASGTGTGWVRLNGVSEYLNQ